MRCEISRIGPSEPTLYASASGLRLALSGIIFFKNFEPLKKNNLEKKEKKYENTKKNLYQRKDALNI